MTSRSGTRDRRLLFLATMAVLIGLLAWALLRPGDPNPPAATAAPTTSATHSAPQPDADRDAERRDATRLAGLDLGLAAIGLRRGRPRRAHARDHGHRRRRHAVDDVLPRRRRRRGRQAEPTVRDPDRRVRRRSRCLCAVRARVQPVRRSSMPFGRARRCSAPPARSSGISRWAGRSRSTRRRCPSARSCPIPSPAGARCSCPAPSDAPSGSSMTGTCCRCPTGR